MLDKTSILRLYGTYRIRQLNGQDAVFEQEAQLKALVAKAATTQFGRDHRFATISSVSDFQARVPIRAYEDFWNDYWRGNFPDLADCTWPGPIPLLARSAGTSTGRQKYLPYTADLNRSNVWAVWDLLVHHVRNRPDSRILGGKCLLLGGSTNLHREGPGVESGWATGISLREMPWWMRRMCLPAGEVARIDDWEAKIQALARLSRTEEVRMIVGVPTWMLIFFDKLSGGRQSADEALARTFPNLELVAHGAVSFVPYEARFRQVLSRSHAETREIYASSEAFIAIADRGYGEGLRLLVDNGVFFEFVPLDEIGKDAPTRHWLANIEENVEYSIVVTTCAGLWSYMLGDTVRFIETRPPRLLVTGRTSYTLSTFAEHVTHQQVEGAVTKAAAEIGADVADYAVGAIVPKVSGEIGAHEYFVELAERLPAANRLSAFARQLDETLRASNEYYDTLRARDFGLAGPRVRFLPPGTFAAWLASQGKLGGQNKVPRIINDEAILESLRRFCDRERNQTRSLNEAGRRGPHS